MAFRLRSFAPRLASAAILSLTMTNATAGSGTPKPLIDELLAAHNRYRQEAGVPPLRWSETLATGARDWADRLARKQTLEHSPQGRSQPAYGENLALMSGDGEAMAGRLVDLWGGEKAHFLTGRKFPDVSDDGDWRKVGHYTQMVWRGTLEVGCALAQAGETTVLVCRYSPPGNWIGEIPY